MKTLSLIRGGGPRKATLGAVVLLGLLSTALMWIGAGILAGIATAAVWSATGVTLKIVAELESRSQAAERSAQAFRAATETRLQKMETTLRSTQAMAEAAKREAKRQGRIDPEREQRLSRTRGSLSDVRAALVAIPNDSREGEAASLPVGPSLDEISDERDDTPLVTVVVPCHNEERYVSAALESVLQQSYPDWECVVVDDASVDGSIDEIRRIVATDERFRVIAHDVNRGAAAARNTGLRAARGRLVTFLDADDLLMADSLLERVEAFTARATADTAGTFCGVRQAPDEVDLSSLPPYEEWRGPRFVDFVSADGECPFASQAPLLRTDLVRQAGGFDETMERTGGEDWALWVRIMRSGFVFLPAAHRTAVYRLKPGSRSTRPVVKMEVSADMIGSAYDDAPGERSPIDARFPFPESLGHYHHLLAISQRSVIYAAMALAQSDMGSADEIMQSLEPGSWTFLERHLDFRRWANLGFRRGLRLDPDDVEALAEDLEPLHSRLLAMVRDATDSTTVARPESNEAIHVADHSATTMTAEMPRLR